MTHLMTMEAISGQIAYAAGCVLGVACARCSDSNAMSDPVTTSIIPTTRALSVSSAAVPVGMLGVRRLGGHHQAQQHQPGRKHIAGRFDAV